MTKIFRIVFTYPEKREKSCDFYRFSVIFVLKSGLFQFSVTFPGSVECDCETENLFIVAKILLF